MRVNRCCLSAFILLFLNVDYIALVQILMIQDGRSSIFRTGNEQVCKRPSSVERVGIRSRLRHVFGKTARREECVLGEQGAHSRVLAMAVNPKMLSFSLDAVAGGVVQVIKLGHQGRVQWSQGRIAAHSAPVHDLKWNPFNDNVLATGSDDAMVILWHVDDGLMAHKLRCLDCHARRVTQIEWHPIADNLLATVSLDSNLRLWNTHDDSLAYTVTDLHALCVAWSLKGEQIAVTTRTRQLSLLDGRTGDQIAISPIAHEGPMSTRVVFITETLLVTTGSNRASHRQLALHSIENLSAALSIIDVDGASGLLIPIVDLDLRVLYLTGKGDSTIRFYELTAENCSLQYLGESSGSRPLTKNCSLQYLGESSGSRPLTAICALPKRALNVSDCEIMRLYRADAEHLLIEPVSFIAPRKRGCFHADLYPATTDSGTPAISGDDWLHGVFAEPVRLQLNVFTQPPTTCKPVRLIESDNGNASLLVTADVNNDRKFRFLSQVYKPDYSFMWHRDEAVNGTADFLWSSGEDSHGGPDVLLSSDSTVDTSSEESNERIGLSDEIAVKEETRETHSTSEQVEQNDDSVVQQEQLNVVLEDNPEPVMPSPLNTQEISGADEVSRRRMIELESELVTERTRNTALDETIRQQRMDIQSLRYEISWKDERIVFLQRELARLLASSGPG